MRNSIGNRIAGRRNRRWTALLTGIACGSAITAMLARFTGLFNRQTMTLKASLVRNELAGTAKIMQSAKDTLADMSADELEEIHPVFEELRPIMDEIESTLHSRLTAVGASGSSTRPSHSSASRATGSTPAAGSTPPSPSPS